MVKLGLLRLKYGFDGRSSRNMNFDTLKRLSKKNDISMDEINTEQEALYDSVSSYIDLTQQGHTNLFMSSSEFTNLEALIKLCDYVYLAKNTIVYLTDMKTMKLYDILNRQFY